MSPNLSGIADLFSSPRWWELKTLRALLGSDAGLSTALGYDFGPDPKRPEYAFLAADVRGARRLFVFLDLGALVAFDLIASRQARLVIHEEPNLARTTLLPASEDLILTRNGELVELSSKKESEETLFLNVVERGASRPLGQISSIDMAGVRIADRVVAFYTESTSARSAVSFSVQGGGDLKYLVAGLAPGTWEIWRNGWLEDPQGTVNQEAGALYFQGPPGGYFFRKLS